MTAPVASFETPNPRGEEPVKLARIVGGLLRGKSNNTTEVTLTANSATTAIAHPLIGAYSALILMPLTANAQAIALPRPSAQGDGTATLTHANDANADKTFKLVIVG